MSYAVVSIFVAGVFILFVLLESTNHLRTINRSGLKLVLVHGPVLLLRNTFTDLKALYGGFPC